MIDRKDLDFLSEWTYWATSNEFKEIFDKDMGKYLFFKFSNEFNFNFLKFWRYLDEPNKTKLSDFLFKIQLDRKKE